MPTQCTLTCARCGTQFTRSMSQSRQAERAGQLSYCSVACRRNGEYRTCEQCGKTFYIKRDQMLTRPGRWCSRTCADVGRKRGEQRTCKVCGESFYVFQSVLRASNTTAEYCSQKCYFTVIGRSPAPRTWKHRMNISKGKRFDPFPGQALYYGPNWRLHRALARRRDNYTCQRCGLVESDAKRSHDIHHIRPFKSFRGDWFAANSVDNLVTLCPACHLSVEPRR